MPVPRGEGHNWQVDGNDEEGLTLGGEGFLGERGRGCTVNGQEGSSKSRQHKQRQSKTRHLVGRHEGEDAKFKHVSEEKT